MAPPPTGAVVGIVLAAGAGSRAGGAKALRRDENGMPWVVLADTALRDGGCAHVLVVLGAQWPAARDLVVRSDTIVIADDWAEGLSASLRAGLRAAPAAATAALITLVDLPRLPAAAVARMLAPPVTAASLRRATFRGRPGHPVLIGRDHWAQLAGLHGDRGAGEYLTRHGADEIDCSDLWDGRDTDGPP